MPRDGAIIFGDLIGKLDVLHVHCAKCSRAGRYQLQRLIEERGRDDKIIDWLSEITADCPKKAAHAQYERSMWSAVPGFAEGAVGPGSRASAWEIRQRPENRPKATGGEHGGRKSKDGIRKNPSNARHPSARGRYRIGLFLFHWQRRTSKRAAPINSFNVAFDLRACPFHLIA